MRLITARYNACSDFRIPKNIPLLSVEDNVEDKAWSWWIKYDTLYYVDDKGEEHEIEAYHAASRDEEFKRPESVHEGDDGEDEDEWADDHLCLQLNHGFCYNNGKHPDTTDEEWKMFLDLGEYSEERYNMLSKHLMNRDGKVNNEDD